ncbi:SOH1-domain-containing protein [Exidia glandulosa HHB12029]|uniref:Mediator of RNA polymerase II transcription subunit 31 n=1 Tax=Exidia glandulosa HHB12029 TaxID=1314781 RepID=A0A165HFH8_EXIGL|nr:SOH1-domain-containing protein [Exidia glandulosa HHB12029]
MSASPPNAQDTARALNRERFELELEFVQALANPYYLQSLAQHGILDKPEFINYLSYLQYWKQKDYARFIQYPHALHHLDLLQHENFRKDIAKDEWREYVNQKQFDHWRTWREGSAVVKAEPIPVPVPAPGQRADSVSRSSARHRTPGTALSTPLTNGAPQRRDSNA